MPSGFHYWQTGNFRAVFFRLSSFVLNINWHHVMSGSTLMREKFLPWRPLTLLHTHTLDAPRDHDDVIKWQHFPCYWPFVRGIHRSPVNSPHKGQWSGTLMFSFICACMSRWVNNREAGVLRRHRAHYDVFIMIISLCIYMSNKISLLTLIITI